MPHVLEAVVAQPVAAGLHVPKAVPDHQLNATDRLPEAQTKIKAFIPTAILLNRFDFLLCMYAC